MSRVIAVSKDRYRATAAERRQYGGSTVTEFFVFRGEDRDDPSKWKVVRGYGPTPGERKTDAIKRSGLIDEPEPNADGSTYRGLVFEPWSGHEQREGSLAGAKRGEWTRRGKAFDGYLIHLPDGGTKLVKTQKAVREYIDQYMGDEPEPNTRLTLDQERDLLTEEVEAWCDRGRHALPDHYFLRIAHDAGVGLTDQQALLDGVLYDLEDDGDRADIAREFIDQIDNANAAQIRQYIDYRDGLIEE